MKKEQIKKIVLRIDSRFKLALPGKTLKGVKPSTYNLNGGVISFF